MVQRRMEQRRVTQLRIDLHHARKRPDPALQLERPEMVKAALHHGAPAKEINLLELYRKLTDPEDCKYPLFYPDHSNASTAQSSRHVRLQRRTRAPPGRGSAAPTTAPPRWRLG